MFCETHKERIAVAACQGCRQTLCADCALDYKGKTYCVRCRPEDTVRLARTSPLFRDPLLAAGLGIIPGLGQWYNGQIFKGGVILLTSWLVLPWVFGIYDAYRTAQRINDREIVNIDPYPHIWTIASVMGIIVSAGLIAAPIVQRQFFSGPGLEASGEPGMKKAVSEMASALAEFHGFYGQYPAGVAELLQYDSSARHGDLCGRVVGGYHIVCEMNEGGYRITARAADGRMNDFVVTSGGSGVEGFE